MSDTSPATRPRRPAPLPVTVVATSRLSPTMVRVVFGGPDLERFAPSKFTDSYVKLTFPVPGVDYPQPLDLEQIRATLPPAQWPVVRTYSVRSWDPQYSQLTVDFVVHGAAFAPPHELSAPFVQTSREGFRISLDVSAYSLIALSRAALPLM